MDLDPVLRHIAVMAAGDASAVQNDGDQRSLKHVGQIWR